jgi:metal-sulfur cluster biosynthetic enzyme
VAEVNEKALREEIMEALEQVIDPELGIDIINLGLVYGVDVDENGDVLVTMTLTAMGCPLAATIQQDVRAALMPIEGVNNVDVNIVWDPPWTKDRLSRYAKIALGIS